MDQVIISTKQIPDESIIRKILEGSKSLFEQIIRRYNQRLFRVGMSILNDDMEVEDAMQNAYIKAYENLSKFEGRSAFGTWLTRIMLNECLAQKKKKQRFSGEFERQYLNSTIMTTPAHLLVNKELNRILEAAVAALPEKYRIVFVLREVEEMSVKDTGEALGIEEANVKVRLNRAKTMLKNSLNGYMKDHVYAFHLTRCDRVVNNVLNRLNIVS